MHSPACQCPSKPSFRPPVGYIQCRLRKGFRLVITARILLVRYFFVSWLSIYMLSINCLIKPDCLSSLALLLSIPLAACICCMSISFSVQLSSTNSSRHAVSSPCSCPLRNTDNFSPPEQTRWWLFRWRRRWRWRRRRRERILLLPQYGSFGRRWWWYSW